MAEDSIFWTTDGTGDGAATGYTMAELTQWLRMLWLNDPTAQGVALGFLNDLEVTDIGSRQLQIDTGGGLIYGYPYWSTSAVVKTLTHPTVGTTGWRLVLRMDWATQLGRLALLESADGVADIPAVTQTANTTWEVSIAYGTITTGDAVSITDDRQYLNPNIQVVTAMVAGEAITPAKIENRTRRAWLGAAECYGIGTLTFKGAGAAIPIWRFQDGFSGDVFATWQVPTIYASGTVTVKIWWVAEVAAGNCRWFIATLGRTNGQSINAAAEKEATADYPVQGDDLITVSELATDIPVSPGDLLQLVVTRDGSHANDTIDADVDFIGFELLYTADS